MRDEFGSPLPPKRTADFVLTHMDWHLRNFKLFLIIISNFVWIMHYRDGAHNLQLRMGDARRGGSTIA